MFGFTLLQNHSLHKFNHFLLFSVIVGSFYGILNVLSIYEMVYLCNYIRHFKPKVYKWNKIGQKYFLAISLLRII